MAIDYPRDDRNDVDVHIARTTYQNHNFLAPSMQQVGMVTYLAVLKMLQNGQVPTGLMTTTTDLEVTCIDTNGERSEYTQQCHGLLARHRNKILGRTDYFWTQSGPDQAVLCDDPDEVIEQLAKMFARPVEQCLVQKLSHWKGAMILPDHWGKEQTIAPVIQDDRDTYQELLKFTPMPPAILQKHYSLEDAIRLTNDAIGRRIAELNATRLQRSGQSTVLGKRGCVELDPLSTREQPRRAELPHFIGTESQVETAMRDLRDKRAFYHKCRELFRTDAKDVVFAAGTVMMRKLGAYCDPLPPSRFKVPRWEFVPPPTRAT